MSNPPENREEALLTVAIPTYNRNQILLRNLKLLLPQFNSRCQLLILDNVSPTPVDETLRELLALYPDVECRIIRHVTNIGANANILRCIELCETPWIWILGDDDPVLPDAIETLLPTLEFNANCTLVNFAIDQKRPRAWTARGVEELAQTLDASADLPWISSSVYRTEPFKVNLKFGYQYIYSMLPHIAILLVALGQNGACHFARERILDGEARDIEVAVEQQWSVINLALGYPVLFDLPISLPIREMLAQKLMLTNLRPGNGLRNVAFQLLLMSVKQRDHRNALYYFDQIRLRQAYRRSFKNRLEASAYWLLLRFPRLGARLYRLAKGHALDTSNYEDRFERM